MKQTNFKPLHDLVQKRCSYLYWSKVICMNLLGWLSIITMVSVLTGCSVVWYAAGEKGVDVTTIQPDVTRAEAEAILGKLLRSWTSPIGVLYCIYEYDSGRPPRKGDAAAVLIANIISLGTFDLFWTLDKKDKDMEKQGYGRTTARVVISYDHDDIVLGVFGEFDDLPPDGRSTMPKPIQDTPNSTD
jgi:hypothetical protein